MEGRVLCICGKELKNAGMNFRNKPKSTKEGRYCVYCGAYLGELVFETIIKKKNNVRNKQ